MVRLAGLEDLEDLPRSGRLDVLCLRPIHHVQEYEALFRLTAAIRERAPALEVALHLRSALRDDAPFARLPAHRVTRLTEHGGRGVLAAALRQIIRGWEPGVAALVLAPPSGWRRVAVGAHVHTMPFGFHGPGCGENEDCAAAGQQFLAALCRETPLWRVAPGAPPPLDRDAVGLRFLIHQARFHIGDVLWLTPLLRALHELFRRPVVTLVGPPVAATVLAGNPHLAELVIHHPRDGEEGRRRVLAALAGRSFDAALFGWARRSESRWLMRAMAAAGVPRRINLEYHDGFLDSRRPWQPATHEGWFFWGTMPSPKLLLHAMDPLIAGSPEMDALDDSLELHVADVARRQADELLAGLGLASRPFAVLAPGGFSSQRWPAASFARLAIALAAELDLAVLIEGSVEEAPLLREVEAALTPGHPSILVRQDPLDVFAALLARARLAVTNDSAPLHFAAALGVPVVYFAQREKLLHSRPASTNCRGLYDGLKNDLDNISVEQALGAVREALLAKEIQNR
jgi:ADP-heptose:LPS heptosyltransferase